LSFLCHFVDEFGIQGSILLGYLYIQPNIKQKKKKKEIKGIKQRTK